MSIVVLGWLWWNILVRTFVFRDEYSGVGVVVVEYTCAYVCVCSSGVVVVVVEYTCAYVCV